MIRVFVGGFSNRVWAAPQVKQRKDGLYVVVGRKDDVTDDAIVAVGEHMAACIDEACMCVQLRALAVGQSEAATSEVQPTSAPVSALDRHVKD